MKGGGERGGVGRTLVRCGGVVEGGEMGMREV